MPSNLFIKWSDLHTSGIPIINEQHFGIVGMINSLFYFMRQQRASEVITPMIAMLEQYAQIHFLTEESILEQASYPELEAHKKLHQSFRTKLQFMSAKSRKMPNPDELLSFLKTWWVEHINEADQRYAAHVQDALKKTNGLQR